MRTTLKIALMALPLAVAVGMAGVPARKAAAMDYQGCMNDMISYGMGRYWGQVGPGLIIRAARDVCARWRIMA